MAHLLLKIFNLILQILWVNYQLKYKVCILNFIKDEFDKRKN